MVEPSPRIHLPTIRSLRRWNRGGVDRPADSGDLRRADDAERQEFDPEAMREQAEEAIDSSTGVLTRSECPVVR